MSEENGATNNGVPEESDNLPFVREGEKWMVDVKVDGVASKVPLAAVTAAYQKNGAADARLEQATHLSRQLAAREKSLQEREAQLARAPKVSLDTMLDSVAKEIYNGNEETVKKALAPVFQSVSTNHADIDTRIDQKVEQRLQDQRIKDAVNWFQATHSDLATDNDFSTFVFATAKNIMDEQPTALPMTVLQTATARVRERLKLDTKKPTTPVARSARVSLTDVEQPQTLADIVGQMNKSRGRNV
jgi:hypothetical protein